MFCSDCGTKLPDEANFCWKCGKQQKSGVPVRSLTWETCEIEQDMLKQSGIFSKGIKVFIAKAIGPKGVYIAGRSREYPGIIEYEKEKEVLDDFIGSLVKDGWEPTGQTGSFYWSYKFRRQAG